MKKVLKNIILTIILILSILLLTGCSKEENVETSSKVSLKQLSIEDFKNAIKKSGITITNETNKLATMIGAEEGYGYEINGQSIEIYKFDEKSDNELTKNNIKSAKEKGIVVMPDFNNMTISVKYNKGLILANYEQHPDKEKILEAFSSL